MDNSNPLTLNINSKLSGNINIAKPKKIVAKAGTSVAILLLIFSILQTKLFFGDYGLINCLPPTFFIALSILVGCSIILWDDSEENNNILIIQFIIFLLGLWLIPFIIEQVPSRTSYACEGYVDYIVRYGALNPEIVFYHNWPAFSIFNDILVDGLGITDLTKLMGITPFILNCFYFLALYTMRPFMLKHNIEKAWWPTVWIFFIANYFGQDYFSPQGMVFFLFLLFIGLLLVHKETDSNANGWRGTILKLLLFSSITISHALTSMLTLVVVFVLNFRRDKWLNSFFLLIMFVFTAWTIYGAFSYLSGHVEGLLREALNLDLYFSQNVEKVGGSRGNMNINTVAFYFTLVFLIFSALGWLTAKKGLIKDTFTRLGIACVFLLGIPYNGEIVERFLLYSLLPLSFFAFNFFRNNKKLASYGLFICLVISIPLNFAIHYGNEQYNYVSPAELTSTQYILEKVDHEFELVSQHDPIFEQRNLERLTVILTSTSHLEGPKIEGPWSKGKNVTQYVSIGRGTWIYFTRFLTEEDRSHLRTIESFLQNSTSYERIYANNDNSIYIYKGEGSGAKNPNIKAKF
jgi:hypothetical protein